MAVVKYCRQPPVHKGLKYLTYSFPHIRRIRVSPSYLSLAPSRSFASSVQYAFMGGTRVSGARGNFSSEAIVLPLRVIFFGRYSLFNTCVRTDLGE